MTRYRMTLRPLTAVHIGSGEVLSPLEYTFRKNARNQDIFVRFQPERLVQDLVPQKKRQFSSLASGNDVLALRDFLSENMSQGSIHYTARVTSGFLREFNAKRGSSANSLEIEADYRPAGQKAPVIPGSSIKGALRTAILNERAIAKREKSGDLRMDPRSRSDQDIQKWALGYDRPNDDPFRAVSIGDCAYPPQGTQLVGRMLHYKPGRQGPGGFDSMAIFAEMLSGVLSGCDTTASTDFMLDDDLADYRAPTRGALQHKAGRKVIDDPIEIGELEAACDAYYGTAFTNEFNTFYLNADDDSLYRSAKNLANLVDSLKSSGEHLVRIGRWSHVESVTLEAPYRRPFGRRGYGKTRTLLEYEGAYLPMGWCAFRLDLES